MIAVFLQFVIVIGHTSLSLDIRHQLPRREPTLEMVRRLASDREHMAMCRLVDYGEAVFPAISFILNDAKSSPEEIAGVICALYYIKAPKGQFYSQVVPYLSHKDDGVRQTAVCLMKQIGTREEGSIFIALLSDKQASIRYEAAEALAAVGERGELAAMDAWLLTGTALREDKAHLKHVKECRDKLEKRLTEASKDKK